VLTGWQTHFRRNRRERPGTFAVIAVVCLALLALLTVYQVVHTHPNASDADHCQLCITMHSAVPTAIAAALVVLIESWSPALVFEMRAATRYWHPQLFTRPPPSGC